MKENNNSLLKFIADNKNNISEYTKFIWVSGSYNVTYIVHHTNEFENAEVFHVTYCGDKITEVLFTIPELKETKHEI